MKVMIRSMEADSIFVNQILAGTTFVLEICILKSYFHISAYLIFQSTLIYSINSELSRDVKISNESSQNVFHLPNGKWDDFRQSAIMSISVRPNPIIRPKALSEDHERTDLSKMLLRSRLYGGYFIHRTKCHRTVYGRKRLEVLREQTFEEKLDSPRIPEILIRRKKNTKHMLYTEFFDIE